MWCLGVPFQSKSQKARKKRFLSFHSVINSFGPLGLNHRCLRRFLLFRIPRGLPRGSSFKQPLSRFEVGLRPLDFQSKLFAYRPTAAPLPCDKRMSKGSIISDITIIHGPEMSVCNRPCGRLGFEEDKPPPGDPA
jgi:hypothetical protein